jgi:hypothetical protein
VATNQTRLRVQKVGTSRARPSGLQSDCHSHYADLRVLNVRSAAPSAFGFRARGSRCCLLPRVPEARCRHPLDLVQPQKSVTFPLGADDREGPPQINTSHQRCNNNECTVQPRSVRNSSHPVPDPLRSTNDTGTPSGAQLTSRPSMASTLRGLLLAGLSRGPDAVPFLYCAVYCIVDAL